jgi:hypothetical protein
LEDALKILKGGLDGQQLGELVSTTHNTEVRYSFIEVTVSYVCEYGNLRQNSMH